MTLAPNRLPLLNGNNLLILFTIITGISSCSSKKITTTQRVEVVSIKTPSTERNTRKEDSLIRKPEAVDIDNNLNKTTISNSNTTIYTKKEINLPQETNRIRNLAVILPFHLSQIPLGQYADDTTKQLSSESKYAMDFYFGCLMAKEKYANSALKANVYFLDDASDSLSTVNLLNQKPFPNVDYIIGPLYGKNLKTIADYAQANKIMMLSPLVNSMYIKDNAYYFNSIASPITQYNFVLEHIKKKYTGKAIEIVYDGQDVNDENIEILKPIANKHFSYNNIKYTSIPTGSDAVKVLNLQDTTSDRIILIYSNKDSYSKFIIGKLKQLKNHFEVFTPSCTRNTKALVDSKNTNTVYTVSPFNTSNPNYAPFAIKFEDKYKKTPTDAVNQGFDLMLHLFYQMEKGVLLPDNTFNLSADFYNTQTKFQFKPILNKNENIDFYDNSYLNLYKYTNGTFVLVAPQ